MVELLPFDLISCLPSGSDLRTDGGGVSRLLPVTLQFLLPQTSLLNSPPSNVSWRSAHAITAKHNAFVTKPLRKIPRNSSPQLGRAVCLSLSYPRPQRTDLCCEPEAGTQSSLSPCTWGNRGTPSRSCPPHSHRFPQQLLLAQALAPLSQALGSTVGRRKKRKRRQHPRGLSGPAPWAWGPESVVAGVGGQEEGSQELLGRWKTSLRIILRP